ncbi:MAG: Two-component hybrid sensor and regulator [uncultured bacterium]|nr:MAG: Two-component hybrid sensor and regulator [uncultured bacterium]
MPVKALIQTDKPLILIVDDAALSLKMAAEILGSKDFRLVLAESGDVALKFIAEHKPDLILLDIVMPDMDGFAVCEKLKSSLDTAAIPVIFLTGRADNGDVTKSYGLGGSDYLTKPFNAIEMLAKVKTHLELAQLKKITGQ